MAGKPETDFVSEQDDFESDGEHASGVVRGVKLLGLRSRNRRNYDTPGVRSSAPRLMEGARVFIDHPQKPTDSRSYRDSFGVAKNVKYVPGKGFYGDIHFNPNHALASQFEWDVKNNPSGLGMSINTRFKHKGVDGNGDMVIESLEEIRSIDVVCRPATTNGVFESETGDDPIMDLNELKQKFPNLVAEIEKGARTATATESESELKKQLEKMQNDLESERAERKKIELKAEIRTEITKALESFDWIPSDIVGDFVECACNMQEESRKKMRGVIERIVKAAPVAAESDEDAEDDADDDDDADDKKESEDDEDKKLPKKGVAGKKKFSLRSYLGVK